jgi:hypothetical protein
MEVVMVAYDDAGTKPKLGPQPGSHALRKLIPELWPRFTDADTGVYNPRDVCGNQVGPNGEGAKCPLSLHAEGRALDIRVFASTDLALGDEIAAWAIQHHEALNIQEVIWNKRIWDVRSQKWGKYTGKKDHTDHVHIGQNWAGATDKDCVKKWRATNPGAPSKPSAGPAADANLLAGIDAFFSAMRYPGSPVGVGATGDPVNAIQWKLNKHAGCNFTCDGQFTQELERKVRDFQVFCKVLDEADGRVGPNSWVGLRLAP